MSVPIPVRNIAKHCNPFRISPWGVKITHAEVARAIAVSQYESSPHTTRHTERIAYLVQHPSIDAIEIDVGVPVLGYHVSWMVLDGSHRLAAAIFRGDRDIEACVSGQLDYAKKLFGVDCEETPQSLERACLHRQKSCA